MAKYTGERARDVYLLMRIGHEPRGECGGGEGYVIAKEAAKVCLLLSLRDVSKGAYTYMAETIIH